MPRKPNYNFERQERDKAKAAKKEAKREAKAGRTDVAEEAGAGGEARADDGSNDAA